MYQEEKAKLATGGVLATRNEGAQEQMACSVQTDAVMKGVLRVHDANLRCRQPVVPAHRRLGT